MSLSQKPWQPRFEAKFRVSGLCVWLGFLQRLKLKNQSMIMFQPTQAFLWVKGFLHD